MTIELSLLATITGGADCSVVNTSDGVASVEAQDDFLRGTPGARLDVGESRSVARGRFAVATNLGVAQGTCAPGDSFRIVGETSSGRFALQKQPVP